MVLDIIAIVISFIALVFTSYNMKWTRDYRLRHQQSLIFSEFTSRYHDIILHMPHEMIFKTGGLSPEVIKYLMLYFNLCSEEYHQYTKGEVAEEIWQKWEDGMRITTKPPVYLTGWKILATDYNDDFEHFMNHKIFKTNN